MTLTKAKLFEIAESKCELVKDVPGFGDVWVRSCPEVQRSQRMSALFGKDGERMKSLRRIHQIIDQVMADETTPMFTEKDVPELEQLDGAKLDGILAAVAFFNEGAEEKND